MKTKPPKETTVDELVIDSDSSVADKDPSIVDQEPSIYIGFPCYKTTNPVTAWCLVAIAKDYGSQIRLDMELGDAMIYHARNSLAHRFLQSKAQKLLFLDDDMIIPIGRPALLRQLARLGADYTDEALALNTVARLASHDTPIVGASYFSRHPQGKAINSLAGEPAYLRRARAFKDSTMDANWVGTGCLMIDREVFDTMKREFPELAPVREDLPWNFFHPLENGSGEDVAFCSRAKECGFTPKVDTMLHAIHVGYATYGIHTI